ncbi:hypothetical protein GC722_16320 [Auraticoccus sp. F435]|uniref:Uncharacterized protein n=1 Tax=Auraticoccus cholistanensis TaxID=2656650 RepID=A0A6A9V1V0_9ACTN|nr:hypothetical protein [Auraticoccus cholistanensis]MVA77570.1 hypothetical protein [Auraticoccus cholistanensis]
MTRRARALALGVGLVLLLAGCASSPAPRAEPSPLPPPPDPGTVLWGRGTLIETGDGGPQLCLGAVAESYPPQCSGLAVAGLDWQQVPDLQQASGVRWTEGYVVGTLAGETFTLTGPVGSEPPPGATPPPATEPSFPQLCEDPFRGGDPGAGADPTDQERLHRELGELPGYVSSWVSDGVSLVNVVVTGDAEEAHQRLRRVWSGGLCVQQRAGVATEEELLAAQQALHETEPGVLSSAPAADGVLEVGVVVADAATVARVRTAVARWLDAGQVRVGGALQPLPG